MVALTVLDGTSTKAMWSSEGLFEKEENLPLVWCRTDICSPVLQVNDWQNDWVIFFARQRIQPQMDMIEKNSGDREARELWAQLQVGAIPSILIIERVGYT